MLIPKSTECLQCSDISSLINEIDCRLAELAKAEYNNVILALNKPIQNDKIDSLLNYKRILTYRVCNQNYAGNITINQIASRVKVLINR